MTQLVAHWYLLVSTEVIHLYRYEYEYEYEL
jgi:hypothetical protein